MMIDPEFELSSDLDWMLQSGQASPAMLAEALVQEYAVPVYRLTHALLGDEIAAHQATVETFAAAVLNVYRYRSSTGIPVWLYRSALEVCLRLENRAALLAAADAGQPAQPPLDAGGQEAALLGAVTRLSGPNRNQKIRLAVFLYYLMDWSPADIGRVLRTREGAIHTHLKAARREILETLEKEGFRNADFKGGSLDSFVAHTLKQRWPAPDLTAAELDELAAAVEVRAETGGAQRRSSVSAKEVLLIGIAILIILGLIWGVNQIMPEPDPEELQLGPATRPAILQPLLPPSEGAGGTVVLPDTGAHFFYVIQPGDDLHSIAALFGVTPETLAALNSLPVDGELHPGEAIQAVFALSPAAAPAGSPATGLPQDAVQVDPLVLDLLRHAGGWQTLWADIQITDYGRQGRISPPTQFRSQVWVTRQGQSLELNGLGGQAAPQYAYLTTGGLSFYLHRAAGQVQMHQTDHVLQSPAIRGMIFPDQADWFQAPARWQDMGEAVVAGRETQGVEWTADRGAESHPWERRMPRRLHVWIDRQTGLILRLKTLGGSDLSTVLSDTLVTTLRIDEDFPVGVFDPLAPLPPAFEKD